MVRRATDSTRTARIPYIAVQGHLPAQPRHPANWRPWRLSHLSSIRHPHRAEILIEHTMPNRADFDAANASYVAGFSAGGKPMPPKRQALVIACMDGEYRRTVSGARRERQVVLAAASGAAPSWRRCCASTSHPPAQRPLPCTQHASIRRRRWEWRLATSMWCATQVCGGVRPACCLLRRETDGMHARGGGGGGGAGPPPARPSQHAPPAMVQVAVLWTRCAP